MRSASSCSSWNPTSPLPISPSNVLSTIPVHVSPERRTTSGTLIHNVRVVDGAQQFIKINHNNGFYADNGVVRCSSLEMTDAGRAQVRDNCYTGGIDGHQAQGWQVYLNAFSGFWCDAGSFGARDPFLDEQPRHDDRPQCDHQFGARSGARAGGDLARVPKLSRPAVRREDSARPLRRIDHQHGHLRERSETVCERLGLR